MKLALHRSITFWSGLLVMGFIVWAWRDSFRMYSQASHNAWWAMNEYGGVGIMHRSEMIFGSEAERSSHAFPHPEWSAFPPPFFLRGQNAGMPDVGQWIAEIQAAKDLRESHRIVNPPRPLVDWTLYIPHWLILLTVAALWLALLFWRARRRRAAAAL